MLLEELTPKKIQKDLAWAVRCPPLLEKIPQEFAQAQDSITLPAKKWFASQEVPDESVAETVMEKLSGQKDYRLGKYFEVLVQAWLEWHPDYEVLACNLPAKDGRITKGEFDLVVRDIARDKTMHWELALKFYLGEGNLRQWQNWYGPNRNDRFDKKLQRLFAHQLTLEDSKEGKQALESEGISIDERWAILKGRLYYPRRETTPGRHFFWWTIDEFSRTWTNPQETWKVLPRSHWLTSNTLPLLNAAEVRKTFVENKQKPMCLMHMRTGTPLFIVNNSWGMDG